MMRALLVATILVPGMELVYESNGVQGRPWRVQAVERDITLGGRTGCQRVTFEAGGPRAGIDVRVTCEADGFLFAWDSTAKLWRQSRPLAPGRTMESRSAAGTVSRYTTGAESSVTIDGHHLKVIETEVVTSDSTGKILRRLRERYAPAIGSAVWGAFEVPEGSGWKTQNEFRLSGLRAPASR